MLKTYTKRTPEQQIADLEEEIERVRQRAAAKEAAAAAKASPDGLAFLAAVKAIDRAIRKAQEAGNQGMAAALEAARAALAPAVVGLGLRLPEKARRGRGRKGEAA